MKLRQLPQLYLRGAIANETMRHLSTADRNNIDRLTREISKMPILGGHRYRFIEKLGQTIGGDYHKNTTAAEQEFNIAIWRALVYLLHHADYTYHCDACRNSEYLTNKARPKRFDRRYPVCPACGAVRITDPGASDLSAGQFITMTDLQRLILKLGAAGQRLPSHTSCVVPTKGIKKVLDHEAVLNDPDQLVKYFGEFVWNYFRQTLRENEIKFHQIDGTWITKDHFVRAKFIEGPADRVAVDEIKSLLTHLKIQHAYEAKGNPSNGLYSIQVELLITNQSVTRALRILIDKYATIGVTIRANDAEITVAVLDNAPIVEASIVTPQPVCIQGRSGTDDDETSVYDTHQHRIRTGFMGGAAMQEDGIAEVESNDLIQTIRDSLNDGAQKVYDIMLGQGSVYDDFVEFNAGPRGIKNAVCAAPRNTHIARFLGTSPRQVSAWVADIRVQCLAHDIGS